VPTVRKQKGLIDIRFLEPTAKMEDFISITEWKTKEDADVYENNGIYRKLVNKLEPFFTKKPELKTYTVEEERLAFWHRRLSSLMATQQVTVASINDCITGFSCLFIDYDPQYGTLLDNLHVRQDFQNNGVGKLLMKNCARVILEKAKSRKMYLWVYELNQNARKVYEHLGGNWLHTARKRNVDGTGANACRYVWEDVASFS
jgi:GNAT superfamily N-acetyltransferase